MYLMVSEPHELAAHYRPPSQDRDSSTRLQIIPQEELSPLLDPHKQPFIHALRAITREERRHLILSFPPSQDIVTHRQLADTGLPKSFTSAAPGSEVWRLIRTHFVEYITSNTATKRGKETHHLNEKGTTLRKIAAFADDFANKYPIPLEILGQRNNDGIPSEILRSEALFELALGKKDAITLTQALKCDESTFARILPAFEKAGLITIDRRAKNTFHPVQLTVLGNHFLEYLLIPIAEMTDYPTDRLDQIKEALGIPQPPYIKEMKKLITLTPTQRQAVMGQTYELAHANKAQGVVTLVNNEKQDDTDGLVFTPFTQGFLIMKHILDAQNISFPFSHSSGLTVAQDLYTPNKIQERITFLQDDKRFYEACVRLAKVQFALPADMKYAGGKIKQAILTNRQYFLYGIATLYYLSTHPEEQTRRRVS